MKQKILILFFALTTSVGIMCDNVVTIDGIYYRLYDNGTAQVCYSRVGSPYSPTYYYSCTTSNNIQEYIHYEGKIYRVVSIDDKAFYGCSLISLKLIIPNSVTNIGSYAFSGCSSLTSIEIPSSVTNIGTSAFSNCQIKEIHFMGTYEEWLSKTWFPREFSSSYELYIDDALLTNAVIPNNVTSIGYGAFYGCNSLISIEIPNSVTSIGEFAFSSCSGLTSIEIPNSVTSIGYRAFISCSGLTSIEIPNSVTSLGESAFSDCSSLNSLTINSDAIVKKHYNSDKQILNTYFGNSSINELIINNGVTSIGNNAFYGCSGLISATIGNSVTSIGDNAFYGCINLTSSTIGNSVTSIGNYAFYNCSNLTSITIPNSVTSIGNVTFSGCSSLPSVTIPNSVTSIGDRAFYGCSNLTSATIGNSVTSIGENAFSGCTYLEDIVIGNGVTTDGIGSSAFANCPYLMSVTCKAVLPPVINADVFEGCGVLSGIDLYVPEESVKRYKKAEVWSEFNIIGKDFPNEDDPSNPNDPEDGKYTITWQDEDGNVIKTDEVEQGATPSFTGTTPVKTATNEYTYEFAGWLPKIQPATKDICYTTFFERNKIETPVYTVNINGENCSLNISNQYPEGAVITVEAVADECFEFQQWSDGSKENPRTITVTKDANLTAEFNKVRYTITDMTEPGAGGKIQVVK